MPLNGPKSQVQSLPCVIMGWGFCLLVKPQPTVKTLSEGQLIHEAGLVSSLQTTTLLLGCPKQAQRLGAPSCAYGSHWIACTHVGMPCCNPEIPLGRVGPCRGRALCWGFSLYRLKLFLQSQRTDLLGFHPSWRSESTY